MSALKPFQAVFYNKEKVSDLNDVVCPPYDVISKEQQEAYHKLSPYNFIRLELAKDSPKDNERENRYTRAKKTFDEWLKKEIMVKDDKPCLYYYKQEYKIRGQKYTRLGLIGLMKLAEDAASKIYPHENTHAAAKSDRLKLWSTLEANLSSIFVCFSDKQKKVEKIFVKEVSTKKPLIDVTDQDRVRHMIWRLEDEDLIQEVVNTVDGPMFIADGHHRYEVSQQYRKMRMEKKAKVTGQEGFNYVMTYFTNLDSPDLQIFPIHRIVKSLPAPLDFLDEYFRIDKIKTTEDLRILLARAGQNEHAFGLYDKVSGIRLLRLKNKGLIDKLVKGGSKDYRTLDASILKSLVFDRVGVESEDIIYSKEIDEAKQMVDESQAECCFLLNPVQIKQLKAIALNGERMPPKTTYFYPKVLSGLTVHKID